MKVLAKLYDGVSSKEHIVELEFSNNKVKIKDFNIELPLDNIKIHSRLGNTPRLIEFPNNIRCKVEDNNKLDEILEKIGYKNSFIHKIESSWKLAITSVVVVGAFIIFMLTVGADYSANFLSKLIPKESVEYISKRSFYDIEKRFLYKSNLSKLKQEQIRKEFLKIANSNYTLYFRSSPILGPNAFALPNGDIVILDELVMLDKDKQLRGVLGVLAHEKAHVVYKHSLRGIIKGAIAATIIGYITGDLSFIVTTLPTIVITNSYSQEFEKEADIYAKKLLKDLNISTKPLAKLFIELKNYPKHYKKDKNNSSVLEKFEIPPIFSTHPDINKRIEFFMKD